MEFLVETRDCYYIFDYFKGDLPYLDKKKEVIVFCSHFHVDHFNPQIFGILDDMGMAYQAVLANDIRKKNHLSDMKITCGSDYKTGRTRSDRNNEKDLPEVWGSSRRSNSGTVHRMWK